jgi:hypothetical protein
VYTCPQWILEKFDFEWVANFVLRVRIPSLAPIFSQFWVMALCSFGNHGGDRSGRACWKSDRRSHCNSLSVGGWRDRGIILVAVALFIFILGVFWLIFPWMVYSMLKNLHEELKRIETNTHRKD